MVLPLTSTAAVQNGVDVVTWNGAALTSFNCVAGATIALAGQTYFVKARLDSDELQLTRVYAGADATVSAEIEQLSPNQVATATLNARTAQVMSELSVLEARGNGFFYKSLGPTGAADPGPGKVGYVGASWAASTVLCVDVLDATGMDRSGLFDRFGAGDIVIIESIATGAFISVELTEQPVSVGPGAWRRFEEYALVDSDGLLAVDEALRLVWLRAGTPGPGYEYDAEVADIAGRAAHDAAAVGFKVFVQDVGGAQAGRSAIYRRVGAAGNWVLVTYFTGSVGPQGDQGEKGWAPQLVVVADGARRVMKLLGYVGGTGTAPTAHVGEYLKGDGTFTATIGDAVDFRGIAGAGTVAAVIQGTGIAIDASDPTQPIVGLSTVVQAAIAFNNHAHFGGL